MNKSQYKILTIIMTVLLLLSCLFVGREAAEYVMGRSIVGAAEKEGRSVPGGTENEKWCVVLDAGHGGDDPGKVGINGAEEKDINLEITKLVKMFLEAGDVRVVLTREDDGGLYDANASNKKVQDMKRRVEIIEKAGAAAVVSIHQNSYPEEYVHGAQVFYYDGSSQGQRLAERIQERLIVQVDPENTRKIKANDSYYLLKKTGAPIVIAECGFLSNHTEAGKLCTPEYRERVAWAIYIGIMQYLNTTK